MRLLLFCLIFLFSYSITSQTLHQKNNDSKKNTLKTNVEFQKKEILEIKNSISEIKQNVTSINIRNSAQLEFYRDTQNTIFWMISLFMAVITGAFILFGYFFKKPDEIFKKIKDVEKEVQKSKSEANIVMDELKITNNKANDVIHKLKKTEIDAISVLEILKSNRELAENINKELSFQYKHQEKMLLLNKKGIFFYDSDDWKLVEVYAQNAKTKDNDVRTVNDWFFIGLSEYKKENNAKAIIAFEASTALDSKFESGWKLLGNAYYQIGDLDNALMAYDKVLDINPNNDLAYNNKGIVYCSKKDFEKSETNYLKAIRLNPNNCFAYTNYFELCLTNNKEIDNDSIISFKSKFKNNTEAYSSFEMIEIYKKIINNEISDLTSELEHWKYKYEKVGFNENFRDIENWILEKVDSKYKDKLLDALNFFSKDSQYKK